MIIRISAELEDSHILELSTRIISTQDLLNVGINGLNLPRHTIQSAVHNHKDSIQEAAYIVLTTWANQQETTAEAYINIIAGLKQCKMNQLATELRQWVEGAAFTEQISKESKLEDMVVIFCLFYVKCVAVIFLCYLPCSLFTGIESFQERLKWSLTGRWEDCLRHDWLPKDKSWRFHLMQYYTDLKWVEMVNLALRKEKKDLESIFDILKVKDAGRKPKRILVEGTYIQKDVIKTLTRNC